MRNILSDKTADVSADEYENRACHMHCTQGRRLVMIAQPKVAKADINYKSGAVHDIDEVDYAQINATKCFVVPKGCHSETNETKGDRI
jgi:hypothetical protein